MCPFWIEALEELIANPTIYDSGIWTITFDMVFSLEITWSIYVLAKLVVEEVVVNVLKPCAVGKVIIAAA